MAELALHFFEGARAAEAERAIGYARVAAEQALLVHAFGDAAAHYDRAVRLTQRLELADPETTCELRLALASARMAAGEIEAGRAEYGRAADVAERARTPELLARAALGFAEWGPYGKVHHEAVRPLERALDRLPDEDSPLRAAALGRLAVRLDPRADQPRREALLAESLAMARRLGDHELLVMLLGISPLVNWRPQSVGLRREHTAEVIALARAGERPGAMWARIIRITDALALGELAGAAEELDAYQRASDELGRMYYQWYGMVMRGAVAAFHGDLDVAGRLAETAIATIRPHDDDCEQEYSVQRLVLGVLRADAAGVPEAVAAGLRRALRRPAAVGRAARPSRPARRPRRPGAASARPARRRRLRARRPRPGPAGRVDAARRRRRRCRRPRGGRGALRAPGAVRGLEHRHRPRGWGILGAAARPLGRLAAMSGRPELAERHFEHALELNEAWRSRPWVLHTVLDYAEALPDASTPRRRRAEALATARSFASPELERRAAAMGRRSRGD